MKLIKNILTALVFWFFTNDLSAQIPDWTIDPSEYQYSMTLVTFLNVGGNTLSEENDKVGAFVGNELRGVSSPIFVSNADRYLAYLTVYANTEGEELAFKIYASGGDQLVDLDTTLTFNIDAQYGNVFQAVSLASPVLSSEAEIVNFYFTEVDSVATVIVDNQVNITLEYNQEVTALIPEFDISSGAKMFIDRELQTSGTATSDFSSPITYAVLSEDESVLNIYEVAVTNRGVSGGAFASTNIVTTNNDGSNDYWIVQDVFKYTNHSFKIYDTNGRVIFDAVGYNNDWNGYLDGNRLNKGNYYYVVRDPESDEVIQGSIMVIY